MGYMIIKKLGNNNLRFVAYFKDVFEGTETLQNLDLKNHFGMQVDDLNSMFPSEKEDEENKDLSDLLKMSEEEILKKYSRNDLESFAQELGIKKFDDKLLTDIALVGLIVEKLKNKKDGDKDNSKRKK
ncbi:MAG: hypothetical protein ACPG5B_06770 [Chitinophagales bacterium]